MSKIVDEKIYRVTVEREPGWWIISVPELDLVTQARRIRDIQHMATDLVAAWLDADVADVPREDREVHPASGSPRSDGAGQASTRPGNS